MEAHYAQQNSKRPPIHRLGVATLSKDLGSKVLGGSNKSVDKLVVLHAFLAQPKVCETQVAVGSQQYIFRFKIPKDNFSDTEPKQ